MKVFKFYCGNYYYVCSGNDQSEAQDVLFNEIGEIEIDNVEEVPESEWDVKDINIWEDNNRRKKPFQICIREAMEKTPGMICSNDPGLID